MQSHTQTPKTIDETSALKDQETESNFYYLHIHHVFFIIFAVFLAKRRLPFLPVMTLRQKSVPVLDKDDPITGFEVGPRVFEFLSQNPLMIVVNIRKELKTSEPDSSEGWRCIYRLFHANQSPVHEIFKFIRLLPVDRTICMIQIEIKFKCYAKK